MSTNMNFGPEWMRGTLPKRTNVLESSRSNSPTTPIGNSPAKLPGNQFPAIQRQHSILDGLTVLDQNSVLTPQSASGFSQDDQQDNPYKYSKDLMLSLFKPYALPVEIEKHDYVIVDECQQPLGKVELSESEKKLLSGPVHSNVSRKRADNATEQNTDGRPLRNKGEFVNNPGIEKEGNSSRFGLNRTRGRQADNTSPVNTTDEPREDGSTLKENAQQSGQGSSQGEDRARGRGDQTAWNTLVSGHDASFDENSVLGALDDTRLNSSDLPSTLPSSLYGHTKFEDTLGGALDSSSPRKDSSQLSDRFNSLNLGNSSFNNSTGVDFGSKIDSPRVFGSPAQLPDLRKAPEQYQWYYRDPTGLVQGPFDAQDMHDWYKAGFFSQTLLVRREDDISFEPLASVVRKIGDDDKPFLTPYNPHLPSTPRSGLDHGIQQQPRMLDDPFTRSPFGIGGGPLGSQPPLHHQSEMLLQQQLPGTHFGNLGGLGGSFFQQRPTPTQPSAGILGSYGSFGTSLFGNPREPSMNSPWGEVPQQAGTPRGSALGSGDLFGSNSVLSPHRQPQTPQSLNPLLSDPAAQAGFLDHSQRSLSQQQMQHQQYMQMLQQKQMFQQQQQFQQQQAEAMNASMHLLHQRQQQQQQQQQKSQFQPEQFDTTAEQNTNATQLPTAPGIEMQMKKPSGYNGWGSAPGTPLFSNASWDPIVSTPSKNLVDESLERRSAVQSPVISPPKQTKSTDTWNTDESDQKDLHDEDVLATKTDAMFSVPTTEPLMFKEDAYFKQTPVLSSATETSASIPKLPAVITAPAIKPVSLREIQEEELKKQKEAAKQQQLNAKAAPKSSDWISPTPWSLADETPKGPSLREIQEMEAKEYEARKSLERQTSAALFSQSSAVPSTPTTVSWGVATPGRNPTPSGSSNSANAAPWASTTAPKKTLREIQLEEEEEARKRNAKLAQQQAASLSATVSSSAANVLHGSVANGTSKGYAGIVGNNSIKPVSQTSATSWAPVTSNRSINKPATTPISNARSAWDTVGSSKPQQNKVSTASAGSAAIMKATDSGERKGPSEDFFRWCRQALKGLDSNVDSEDFMQMLVAFPLDNSSVEIIQDMIYANSTSLDGRRFADEFMKRRKADIAGKLNVSNVLPVDEDANAFKVVSKKKKFVKA